MLFIYFPPNASYCPKKLKIHNNYFVWKCLSLSLSECRLQVKLALNEVLRGMGVKEMNLCQHVSCLKPQTLKTAFWIPLHCFSIVFYVNVRQTPRVSSFACTRRSKARRTSVFFFFFSFFFLVF